jgi:hypothetical protein
MTQTSLDLKNPDHLTIKLKLKLLELALRFFNKTVFREDDEETGLFDSMPFAKIKEDEAGTSLVQAPKETVETIVGKEILTLLEKL